MRILTSFTLFSYKTDSAVESISLLQMHGTKNACTPNMSSDMMSMNSIPSWIMTSPVNEVDFYLLICCNNAVIIDINFCFLNLRMFFCYPGKAEKLNMYFSCDEKREIDLQHCCKIWLNEA
jgi:hypothetical protein